MNGDSVIRAAGWISAGAGLAMLAAPRQVARVFGKPDTPIAALLQEKPMLIRATGARDLANGVLILRRPTTSWVALRVLSDAADIGLMTAELVAGRFRDKRSSAVLLAMIAPGAVSLVASLRWLRRPKAAVRN